MTIDDRIQLMPLDVEALIFQFLKAVMASLRNEYLSFNTFAKSSKPFNFLLISKSLSNCNQLKSLFANLAACPAQEPRLPCNSSRDTAY